MTSYVHANKSLLLNTYKQSKITKLKKKETVTNLYTKTIYTVANNYILLHTSIRGLCRDLVYLGQTCDVRDILENIIGCLLRL